MGLVKIARGNFKETNSIMDLGAGLTDLFCVCVCSVLPDSLGFHGL